jgi:cellulose synthase/poly-beta-1,6-N-acetylglucosamine synthase-like glycosyltransferase
VVPKVDIIITTYNEHVENVIDTVAAAAAIDYPQDKFRVIVSDDGKDGQLKASVQELTNKYPNIVYFARDKKNRPLGQKSHGSKAGNVNDCAHHTASLDGTLAKYLVCLDADMIPSRDILRALVAHAECNDNIGMVTLPQVYYPCLAGTLCSADLLIELLQFACQRSYSSNHAAS